ncbi:MAG: peroxiredoxin family protein [Planctomycetota bacterium]|jgi:thiol-disulfide isomerase/thioredoxin
MNHHMRICGAGLLCFCGAVQGEGLTIGDPAPPIDVAHWMKGDALEEFEVGRVYVLEFWATWCGPCIAGMDHLSQTQKAYERRGVTVIGLSDEPLQKTVKFLCSRFGPEKVLQNDRIAYTLATDPDRSVHRDYLEAAAILGIPTAFVIGKDGRVEWIGHPMEMDPVLEAVVEDRWDRAAVRAEMLAQSEANREFRQASDRLMDALAHERWDEALVALDLIIADGHETYIPTKFLLLLSRVDKQRAYEYGRQIMALAWDDNPWLLHHLAWSACGGTRTLGEIDMSVPEANRDLDFALETARRAVAITGNEDEMYVSMLARVYAVRGEFADAAQQLSRALELLEAMRPKIGEAFLDQYESDLKDMRRKIADYEVRAAGNGRS